MVDVVSVQVVENRTVRLGFSDGSTRVVDLTPLLWGPVFESVVESADFFRRVRVNPDTGTVEWPNGADLDPDVLHGDFEPAAVAPLAGS